jgi:hypothetical protein
LASPFRGSAKQFSKFNKSWRRVAQIHLRKNIPFAGCQLRAINKLRNIVGDFARYEVLLRRAFRRCDRLVEWHVRTCAVDRCEDVLDRNVEFSCELGEVLAAEPAKIRVTLDVGGPCDLIV